MDELMQKLLDVIIDQAEYFLNEFGDFFPFATIVNMEGEIKPLGVFFGDDKPTSMEVISHLEKALKKGVEEGDYRIVAICISVLVRHLDETKKVDALEIRIDSKDFNNINFTIPFKKLENGKFEYGEMSQSDGALDVFPS